MGVEVVETYNRRDLIQHSIATLTHELTVEMIVMGIIIVLFLLHLPSAIVLIYFTDGCGDFFCVDVF